MLKVFSTNTCVLGTSTLLDCADPFCACATTGTVNEPEHAVKVLPKIVSTAKAVKNLKNMTMARRIKIVGPIENDAAGFGMQCVFPFAACGDASSRP
jgi:hypothetical protein